MAARFPWHRVFHPLSGADLPTLTALVLRNGPPDPRGLPPFAVAAGAALARLPFTLAERLLPPSGHPPPVFILGHPRSGTTHLHNLMAATGVFATVPPVRAVLPWEARTLAPLLKPVIDPFLPETRLIDGVALHPDAPTEDEVGLANMGPSCFHAIYFPRRFAATWAEGLLRQDPRREQAVRRHVGAMARGAGGRTLLLKNPALTAHAARLPVLFPGARIVHIHRDPVEVFDSTRRMLRRAMAELALQDPARVDVDAAVLETYPAVLRAFDAGRGALPAGTLCEVSFADLTAKPLAVLRRIWDCLDLPGGAAAPARAQPYLDGIAAYRPARHRLGQAEIARLRARWPSDLARYGQVRAAGGG